MTSTWFARLLVPVAVSALSLLVPAPAQAAGFSTDPVEVAPSGTAQTVVSAVDTGHHAGFDRVVFTFTGPVPGYSVTYAPEVIRDGSGAPVTLQGSSFAVIRLRPTSTVTHAPQDRISPHFPMLRELAGAGDFEAVTSYGVGLADRSGLRVSTLAAPNRMVVDFAIPAGTSPSGSRSGSPTGGAATVAPTDPGSTARSAGGTPSRRDPATPVLPIALGAAGVLLLALAGYHLRHRRPA
ncbi:MAG TPA: hypothetical protein VFX70_03625 [Mycobacteriales bacterium]|nr:hypothetical protein [Mycobacteriales bacterium]